MRRTICFRAVFLYGGVAALAALSSSVLAANPPEAQTGSPGSTAAPARSFGRSTGGSTIVSRSIVAGTGASSTATVTRGGSVAGSPRSSGTRGTVRPASIPNPRAVGPVINGTNVVNRVPGASRVGDSAPGVITGGFRGPYERAGASTPVLTGIRPPVIANGPPVPYGGVTPNRGGVIVNPSQGWDRGPAVIGPTGAGRNEPAIENSEWYRRYRDRYDTSYDSGYRYGGHNHHSGPYRRYYWGAGGPVFLDASTPMYIDSLQNYYWNNSLPVVFGGFDLDQGQARAEVDQRQDEPRMAEDRGPADRPDAADANPPAGRARASTRLSPEKLHELMIEGVTFFEVGKYNESASKFLRVTLADRQNVDATLAYAVARFATGDYQIAGLAVRRGVRRMPEVVDSDFDVRARYGDLHDLDVHLARLESYLANNPGDEDAWVVLGFIRHFSGQRELAAETFDRLKELPRADLEVADIFLSAKPLGPAAQTQPAEAAPMVPGGGKPLLPGNGRASLEQELISVEIMETSSVEVR